MKNRLLFVALFIALYLYSSWNLTGISTLFKDPEGKTNWQHLANWSSATLIILLSIVTVYLFLARRRAHKANRELTAIRNELEQRVQERTASLDLSNQHLKQSNLLLEDEIARHLVTADQLRASESYIRDILNSMPLILVGLDKDGLITQWNKRAAEVSGIPAKRALGKTLWEAYPKTTVLPEHIQKSIESQQTIHLKQSYSDLYHFDVTIYPLQNQDDAGVVILVEDVTKQVAAENMLIHNDKMSFMGELASTMAHDINLPLRAMMMDMERFRSILAENNSDCNGGQAQAGRLNTILCEMLTKGDQVSSIIGNLLAIARGRSGKKQITSVADVMDNSIQLASEVIAASEGLQFSEITIERNYDKNLPLVSCYATELQLVFISLFRHACYSLKQRANHESFQPTLKIRLAENYGNLWIKIQHNGQGLTSEEQMYIFEPFFTNNPPAVEFDAGQRLSFSHYIIVEQHRGQMAVTSDVSLGSTFHIQLPLETAA
ncbi:MAG: PAS domain S-box protein [Gammaproteobacteria bacterium]|nr:PAS domain S-box protein [Gammaproteobacteria bacterium]